jgi:hypothetical protein
MGRKAHNISIGRKHNKRKEIYFNFNKLRKTLTPSQKTTLISFFTSFKQTFKDLQTHIYNTNKKFDILETHLKSFQINYLRSLSLPPSPPPSQNDFILNDIELAELFKTSPN